MSQTQQINFVEIEELYREFGQPAYNLAFRLLGSSEAAEEAVQAVFLDYWRLPVSIEREEFLRWLLHTVRRKCLGQGVKVLPVKPATAKYSPQTFKQVLDSLPTDQKQLIEQAYFTGQDHRQLAETLRLPANTVKTTIIRGLVQLKKNALEHSPN